MAENPSKSAAQITVTGPTTDDDWTIHSINIHGVFFERWCQRVISETNEWKIKSTNYPVEFPPPNGPFRGKESTLDIRAELNRDLFRLTLLIECKKNNPDFVNWIFFPKSLSKGTPTIVVSRIDNIPRTPPVDKGWEIKPSLHKQINESILICDEARETRGSYFQKKNSDKTKTSNAAIGEAAHQVALASEAIFLEEIEFSKALESVSLPHLPWTRQVFIPCIVTSANIFACEFDPSDVSPATGEVPFEKARLISRQQLYYEYPLPRHLQKKPADLVNALKTEQIELFMRKHILIIHSAQLPTVLNFLAENAERFFP